MNDNIIKFYILANRLKNIIRTGWKEIEIEKDRLESDAEHIFGTLVLAIVIDSEYNLELDMLKVLKILTLHELEEILMPDYTIRSKISKEEKRTQGKKCVHKIVSGLVDEIEIENLLDEFNDRKTKEAKFCYMIDKIECDFQAKLYDLEGAMKYESIEKDLEYYGTRADKIKSKAKHASDFWIEYDKINYQDDNIFNTLINDIQKIDKERYKKIVEESGDDINVR